MKSLEQVKQEVKYGNVYLIDEFIDLVKEELMIPYDGVGYLHDGEKETNISVWSVSLSKIDKIKYPYVCWYNK